MVGVVFRKPMMNVKELTVEDVKRTKSISVSLWRRRGNVDLDPTLNRWHGQDGTEDTTHWIDERAIEEILKLGMTHDWE